MTNQEYIGFHILHGNWGVVKGTELPALCITMACENCRFYDGNEFYNESMCKERLRGWLKEDRNII